MKRFLGFLVCILFLGTAVFAESIMEPDKINQIDENSTKVEFKTDVSDVEVYINGTFFGRTNLEVENLLPGVYSVELKKSGYKTINFGIEVKKSYELIFSFEMALLTGQLTVYNLKEDCEIWLNAEKIESKGKISGSMNMNLVPGEYELLIREFGFKDFKIQVKVEAEKESSVVVVLEEAEFEVSDFKALESVFNPDYSGKLGRCSFEYKVSKNGEVLAEIRGEDGSLVWNKVFCDFDSWKQEFSWDGKNNQQEKMPDGVYKIYLSAGGETLEQQVTINHQMNFPLFSSTVCGSGTGKVPGVWKNNKDYLSVYLKMSPMAAISEKSEFYGYGLNAGAIWDFKNHFEISGAAGTVPGFEEGFAGSFNAAFKAFDSVNLPDGKELSFGGLVRYGYSTLPLFEDYGIDSGSGLGIGGLLGLSFERFYFGYNLQFIYSAATGNFDVQDCVLENGLCLKYDVLKKLSLEGWFGLDSAFNVGEAYEAGGKILPQNLKDFYFARGIDAGAGVNWMFYGSSLILDVDFDVKVIFGFSTYFSTEIGLSYLF